MERTKMSNLRNGSKGGFEPGLTWLRVRHSTTELPHSTPRSILHTCVRIIESTAYGYDDGFLECQNFTSAVCAYSIDTGWYNVEANHEKVQRSSIYSPDITLLLSCLRSHWPTYTCASAACEQSKQKRWLDKSKFGERFPVGKSLLKRAGAVPRGCK